MTPRSTDRSVRPGEPADSHTRSGLLPTPRGHQPSRSSERADACQTLCIVFLGLGLEVLVLGIDMRLVVGLWVAAFLTAVIEFVLNPGHWGRRFLDRPLDRN